MIFGKLLTGSSYNDAEKKITGGRNGYGAKLTNIYSKYFSVTCGDRKRKKQLKTTWRDSMSVKDDLQFKEYKAKSDFVLIEFMPDFEMFKIKGFTKDIIA